MKWPVFILKQLLFNKAQSISVNNSRDHVSAIIHRYSIHGWRIAFKYIWFVPTYDHEKKQLNIALASKCVKIVATIIS